jgi:hypothetical protein
MYFTFEHEASIIPITLTIRVEYVPYHREADYENPSEFDYRYNYELYCGNLNLTECIGLSNFVKLQDELETAMREAITEHFFNQQ